MKKELLNTIDKLRKKGDYQYILSAYVDHAFWMEKLRSYLPEMQIENLTDFNYSTCFTMYINISDTDAHVGTDKFIQFLKNNLCLYRIQVQVSAIAPYAICKYVRYSYDNEGVKMTDSFKPFLNEHAFLGNRIIEFLIQAGIKILNEEMLSVEVSNISLELRESNVTVYHCLFEDEC